MDGEIEIQCYDQNDNDSDSDDSCLLIPQHNNGHDDPEIPQHKNSHDDPANDLVSKTAMGQGQLYSMTCLALLCTGLLFMVVRTGSPSFMYTTEEVDCNAYLLQNSSQNINSSSSAARPLPTVPVHNTSLAFDPGTDHCDLVTRASVYSPECCHFGNGIPRRLLITGTGRSGTSYLAYLFQSMGFRVSHDNGNADGFLDGAVSWPQAFDDSFCLNPWWTWRRRLSASSLWRRFDNQHGFHDQRLFLHVLHSVREPLKSIMSRWDLGDIGAFESTGAVEHRK